jgi:hypothetical protein
MRATQFPRLRRTLAPCVLGLALVAQAATDARVEYEAILALSKAKVPEELAKDEAAKIAWLSRRAIELHDRGVTFLDEHAADPLRWDTLVLLPYGRDHRERIWRSGFRQLVPVPESLAAWEKQYYPRLESLLRSTDAGPPARAEALRLLIRHTSHEALRKPAVTHDAITRVRAWIDQHDREFPRSGYTRPLYHRYAELLDFADPVMCMRFLAELESRHQGSDPFDKGVRELVASRRRALEAQEHIPAALWARLRDLDRNIGNMDRYRGKVVLIALGPVTYNTLWEQLEDLHAQHHAAGLEIIQVAPFNRAFGLPPEPEQRRNMETIVNRRRWPWPVLWNPKGHDDLAAKWGHNTVPAWILIGRHGRIIGISGVPFSVSIPRELARTASREP